MATPAQATPQLTIPIPILPGAPGVPVHVPGTGSGIPNPLHAIKSTGDFLTRLTDPHTWIRVAEVGVGLLLIGVGINAMLHNAPLKTAQKVTKAGAKFAA